MCATACWDLHAGVDVQRSCSFNCLFASMICMFEAANTQAMQKYAHTETAGA